MMPSHKHKGSECPLEPNHPASNSRSSGSVRRQHNRGTSHHATSGQSTQSSPWQVDHPVYRQLHRTQLAKSAKDLLNMGLGHVPREMPHVQPRRLQRQHWRCWHHWCCCCGRLAVCLHGLGLGIGGAAWGRAAAARGGAAAPRGGGRRARVRGAAAAAAGAAAAAAAGAAG